MKISFDGLRKNLARSFNELAETELTFEQREIMRELREFVGALLCCHDPRDEPQDCNMLADQVELVSIPRDDGEDQE